jgi:hypothetical protein
VAVNLGSSNRTLAIGGNVEAELMSAAVSVNERSLTMPPESVAVLIDDDPDTGLGHELQ